MDQQPQPLTDRIAEALRTLDLIQEERDHQPRFFKANYELHAPRLLDIAQSLRGELAARDAQIARLTAELAAADDATNEAMLHNDATCEAVAERDQLRREVGLYVETLHRRDATIAQFRAALAVDHHVAYHQGEPSDGLLYHCGRDHCPAPVVPSAD